MATTEAQICNLALLKVGQREQILSLGENSASAQACAIAYPQARDSLLASWPWRFAAYRATLALLANVERSGWEYAYALPADCLEARSVYPGARVVPEESKVPFAIEHEPGVGRVLLTDQEDAELLYTRKVETVVLYPPLFVEALAAKLAIELAFGHAVKPALADQLLKSAELALSRACASELRQGQQGPALEPSNVRVRQ